MNKNLIDKWLNVSKTLKINIVVGFQLEVSDQIILKSEFLVKKFGAEIGMLVFTNFSSVAPYVQQIIDMGYGFSVLSESNDENINIEEYVEVLNDWGWSGAESEAPDWCAR